MISVFSLYFVFCVEKDAPRCLTEAPKHTVRERIDTMSECQVAADRYRQALNGSKIAIPGMKWGLICESVDVPREIEL